MTPDQNFNQLKNILDFILCKQMVCNAIEHGEKTVILCPDYSINIQSKYENGEDIVSDLQELEDYIGFPVEVTQYDNLVVNFINES